MLRHMIDKQTVFKASGMKKPYEDTISVGFPVTSVGFLVISDGLTNKEFLGRCFSVYRKRVIVLVKVMGIFSPL
jgi:hypothetical protein